MKHIQYTLRQIPPVVDQALRQNARQMGRSLNEVAIEAITRGAGISEDSVRYHDLDDLSGSWKKDPQFDKALRMQDVIDPDLWK